jgi:hypothetical protein
MLARIGVIGTLLIIVLISALLYVCNDRRESEYATLAEVGDAMAHGWLPGWITSDAQSIREIHDIDTNETWGVFTFGHVGSDELAATCSDVPDTTIPFPRTQPSRWWPRELVGTAETSPRYRFMKCQERSSDHPGQWETSDAFAAVNVEAHAVYFWRESR